MRISYNFDTDNNSVGTFIESFGDSEFICEAFEAFEALQKPSASDDSDSDDQEFWLDIYYLKAFDTSGNELPMTSEIVEDQSIKVIAYRRETWRKWRFLESEIKAGRAIQAWWKAMKAKEQQAVYFVFFSF